MKTSDFDYNLPQELIAQTPVEPRDSSRLLVYHRDTGVVEHKIFRDVIDYLNPGDVLVINQTRVIPARLYGVKEGTGGAIEFLLLRRLNLTDWEVILKPGKKGQARRALRVRQRRARRGNPDHQREDGGRTVRFFYEGVFEDVLDRLGQMPLPPYIHEKLEDKTRYQTVYAKVDGSAAAPTAGLHFTPALLEKIRQKGVDVVPVLLHVGLGTFRPVKEDDVADQHMHSEYYEVTPEQAEAINAARARGGRIVCVGTTSVRTLETVATEDGVVHPGSGFTQIFITPGVKIKAVDALITNFHLPQSTLLMLISALMGRENALDVYRQAVEERYRFFSFGDAMMITGKPQKDI
ncbi:MAG: tRNA preQ1(34) S-adenosylmethionine ribosyltransferase-isomerase QueA [Christensenellales bacterium]